MIFDARLFELNDATSRSVEIGRRAFDFRDDQIFADPSTRQPNNVLIVHWLGILRSQRQNYYAERNRHN